jgi:serine/threonine protein kinase
LCTGTSRCSAFCRLDKWPHIWNSSFTKGKTDDADSPTVYLRPECYYSPEVLKNQEFKFVFASDVYLFAIFCYEVIEGRLALFARGQNTAAMKKLMIAGDRLQWTAAAAQQQLVEAMWSDCPEARAAFEEVVQSLEDERVWFPGTDVAAFYRSKGDINASNRFHSSRPVANRSWVNRVPSLRRIEEDLQCLGGDIVSVVVHLLFYVTVGSNAADQGTLEQLHRSSFAEAYCIDSARFLDNAREFSAESLAELMGFGFTPLTGAIVDESDLVVGELIGHETFWVVYKGTQTSRQLAVVVKKLKPNFHGARQADN